ncbi:MAG: SDR family oxidoreductase [Chitinophagales bacterium]
MQDYFKDKSIVITGATSGLGRRLAEILLSYSAHVTAIGRNKEALSELEALAKKSNGEILCISCDVGDYEQCKSAFKKILDHFGKVDVLINNAGITNISKFEPGKHVEVTKSLFQTNFFGAVNCTELAYNSIVQHKGSIVNISSVAGYSPLMGRTAYSASKHAMHGFFDTLRTELKEHGVNVMMACPTFIQTGIRTSAEQKVQGETLSVDYVANKILKGIVKRKRLLLIGKTATFAYWINKLFPETYEKIMIRNQKNKF